MLKSVFYCFAAWQSSSLLWILRRTKINFLLPADKLDARDLVLSEWIASRLRRAPTWVKGHLEFGEAKLRCGDKSGAFASAEAVFVLSKSPRERAGARFLLARSFQRCGAYLPAIEHFEALLNHPEFKRQNELREEMAAALLAVSEPDRAKKLLEEIPPALRTPAGQSALLFLLQKKEGG